MREDTAPGTDATVLLAEGIRATALGVLDMRSGVGSIEATYGRTRAVLGVGVEYQPDHVSKNLHVIMAAVPIPGLTHWIGAAVRARVRAEVDVPAQPITRWIDDLRMAEPLSNRNDRP